ncbi:MULTISPECIES: hypothetical protein [Acinetobacter calcoaceticus/baumannii complex]|uniref:hypothetical protein n=1 Tax=Acinetobacter calcoaceticus/baumannii complex TaxID=909768 RepID=UPI000C220C41|nr:MULTISPECIES: hypothetical protein [Acinetobacter calcoaceticus/baumannii complex]PJG64812.1 hypothetical protein CVD09_19650 [Acinetobacter seifertii]RIX34710.1 hypothetical protein D3X57_19890 [Acinetobacter baumannii]RIX39220.1 hypothetical protein D3X54_17555 [Acinetobacter baumannii]RJO32789.1 hypothetical protein D3X44_16205 [Acinetobacter baumannii]
MGLLEDDFAIKFVAGVALVLILFGGLGFAGYLIGLMLNLYPLSLGINPVDSAWIGGLSGAAIGLIVTLYHLIKDMRDESKNANK